MKLIAPILGTYRTFSNVTRMRRILSVFFRNGLGMFFGRLQHLVTRRDRNFGNQQMLTFPERLRKSFEELGPVYVKVGQMLSTRPDLIGQDFADELAKLQDQVPPFPFSQVREVVQEELGAPLEELFAEFQETPTAAASLAQGHRATLKDGTKVFVKVQRPHVAHEIQADMNVLVLLADHLHETTPELRFLMLPKVARQFQQALQEEADYNTERGNIRRFGQQFADHPNLVVPKVFDHLSTSKVLTMEYIDGIKISKLEELRNSGADLVSLSETTADLTLKQFFTYGFFHADPHPGNIFVLPENKICYIDFGLCGRITREERTLFCRLILSILERDEQHASQLLLRLCDYEQEPDMDDLECVVGEFIDKYFYGPLSQLNIPEAIQQLFAVCNRMKVTMKPHIYLMVKALGTLDDMGRKLNPDYDLEKQLKPALTKVAMSQFSLHKSLPRRIEGLLELADLVSKTPNGLRNFANKLMSGQLTFRQEVPELKEFFRLYAHTQCQKAAAILTIGILLNSSILLACKIPPLWNEFSILGGIGLITGIIFAAVLTIDLMKKP